jgi:hypothetical protein
MEQEQPSLLKIKLPVSGETRTKTIKHKSIARLFEQNQKGAVEKRAPFLK